MAGATLPPFANIPWVDSRGYLTVPALQVLTQLWNQAQGSGIGPGTIATGLGNYRNDAQAAAGGVPLYGLYWNGSVLQGRKI